MKRMLLIAVTLVAGVLFMGGCVRDIDDYSGDRHPSAHHGHYDHPGDHQGDYRPDDHPGDHHQDDNNPNGDHHPADHNNGDHQAKHDDPGNTDHDKFLGRNEGERAIVGYCAEHLVAVKIIDIKPLADPAASALPRQRYQVSAEIAGNPIRTRTVVVDYNAITGKLSLQP